MNGLFQKLAANIANKSESSGTPFGKFLAKIMRKQASPNASAQPNQRRASVINQTQASEPNSTLLS